MTETSTFPFMELDDKSLGDVLDRIDENTSPKWGNMGAHKMIEHLVFVLRNSIGEPDLEVITPEAKIPMFIKFLRGPHPMPREFKAEFADEFMAVELTGSLDEAKDLLMKEWKRFEDYYQKNPDARHVHAIYGPLGKEDWMLLHRKHFQHHFEQFGLM